MSHLLTYQFPSLFANTLARRTSLRTYSLRPRPMLGIGEFFALHQDAHQLRQRGDLLILHADDRQQFEDDQEQKKADANQREGGVLDVELLGDPPHRAWPDRQPQERQRDQHEKQRVALLELIPAQSEDGEQQEDSTESHQKQGPEDSHLSSRRLQKHRGLAARSSPSATARAPRPGAGRPSP